MIRWLVLVIAVWGRDALVLLTLAYFKPAHFTLTNINTRFIKLRTAANYVGTSNAIFCETIPYTGIAFGAELEYSTQG